MRSRTKSLAALRASRERALRAGQALFKPAAVPSSRPSKARPDATGASAGSARSRQPGIVNLPWDELWEPAAVARRSWWNTAGQRATLETLAETGITEPLRVCRRVRGGWELVDGDSARLWFAAVGLIMTGRWAPDLHLPCREVPASSGFVFTQATQGGLNV